MDEYLEKKKDELLKAVGAQANTDMVDLFREKAYSEGVEGYLDFLTDLTQAVLDVADRKDG
jgi:hypothetical protein